MLLGIFFGLPSCFLHALALKSVQALEHIGLHKNGLHAHLQLVAAIYLVDIAEVLNRLRVELGEAFEQRLRALLLEFLDLLFELEHALVEIDGHFELACLVCLFHGLLRWLVYVFCSCSSWCPVLLLLFLLLPMLSLLGLSHLFLELALLLLLQLLLLGLLGEAARPATEREIHLSLRRCL